MDVHHHGLLHDVNFVRSRSHPADPNVKFGTGPPDQFPGAKVVLETFIDAKTEFIESRNYTELLTERMAELDEAEAYWRNGELPATFPQQQQEQQHEQTQRQSCLPQGATAARAVQFQRQTQVRRDEYLSIRAASESREQRLADEFVVEGRRVPGESDVGQAHAAGPIEEVQTERTRAREAEAKIISARNYANSLKGEMSRQAAFVKTQADCITATVETKRATEVKKVND